MRKKLPIYQLILLWLVLLFQWDWAWLTLFGVSNFITGLKKSFKL